MRRVLAGLVVAVVMASLTIAMSADSASAYRWDEFASCPPGPAATKPWFRPDWHCLGERVVRSRGHISGECMQADVLLAAGTIYPNSKFCGKGPEAIAQSRVLAYLGKTYAYNAEPEWEVQLPDTLGRRTYADVVYPTGDALEVFELKLTSNWGPLAGPALQAGDIAQRLSGLASRRTLCLVTLLVECSRRSWTGS